MQTIDRAMQVIKVLSKNDTRMWISITDLSKECDLPVSTLHRLLQSMKQHGLIQQDPDLKLYSMGNTWLEYGLKMYDTFDFVGLIRPEMEKLMHEVEESVYFSKPIGLESLVVERIDCLNNPIRINDQLGIRIPLNIGAANKVLLANMPNSESVKVINSLVPSEERDSFIKLLSKVRRQGYGESHGEQTPGTSSVAAPIFDHANELLGAISIGYVNFNITEERQNCLIEKVIEYGMRICNKLGSKN
ncbi:IclR family transcriptional regulator [Cytobacillus firmus]|uniref:IclR family transcriptional regulator n=1 Tax=Bacillaceae TaxID=186817 RepID=UPI0018CE5B58|nr:MULTISPECIES: IclR family transcriptional regulator [Bacillaceae]MBG9587008.1 IclR family transcriptional regulator [Cytobacillus firmus]MBN8203218.1 IclR family transcriptional regulator [Bacillus sp. NTK034]USK37006.1 IclR family transcriptional regulator [Cytobacillus firmus]WHY59794.1 IclR family transcriptional regulator [Cytobacillus firmus]